MTDKESSPDTQLRQVVLQFPRKNHVSERQISNYSDTTDVLINEIDTVSDVYTADEICVARQMLHILDHIQLPAMRAFLDAVFYEREVFMVLAQSIQASGTPSGSEGTLRIHCLQELATGIMTGCAFGALDHDVIYITTLLHGIGYWLKPCVVGNSDLRDDMFTIIRPHLCELAKQSPDAEKSIRLCMGWSGTEAEKDFADWLGGRMQRAMQALGVTK